MVSPTTQETPSEDNGAQFRRAFGLFCIAVLFIVLLATFVMSRGRVTASVYGLQNFMGPVAQNLVEGKGFFSYAEVENGTAHRDLVCFRAHRMPLVPWFLAAVVTVVGDHIALVNFVKSILFILPLLAAAGLGIRAWPGPAVRQNRGKTFAVGVLLLLAAFFIPTFLIDVVNLQVEEGYTYSLIILALAILLFVRDRGRALWGAVFTASLLGIYLSKSSMLPLCLWFLAAFAWRSRPVKTWLASAGVFALALVLWGSYVHTATGRFSLGTSIDGANFYKGNNALLLPRYPPPGRGSLDPYDFDLYRGQHFHTEWAYNDYSKQQAVAFIKSHPKEWAVLAWRKIFVLTLSCTKIGGEIYTGKIGRIEWAGLAVARLAFWAAIVLSLLSLRSLSGLTRYRAWTYLGFVVTASLPYIAGFALTRHSSILIYPSFLMLYLFWMEHARREKDQTQINTTQTNAA